ncbi:MAG: glycogen debranching protein GlgX [Burkholderiales bacterium]|nr:glycogen debranching protein GlgX [Burkholderiales bacterium]
MTPRDSRACLPCRPWPLGATPMEWQGHRGVNLAVFSRHATAVHWCLFDADGHETDRVPITACTDGIWHGFLPGLEAGQLYGLRAEGPWQPAAGHRFNAAKLLIDPYARELVGSTAELSKEVAGQEHPDPHDNAGRIPKARVIDLQRELAAGAAVCPAPPIPREQLVIYEAHVKGLTRLHPGVPEDLRGNYAGLASAAMLAHYRKLGVTTLCLLPVQLHVDEKHLLDLGLSNYWGYNTLGFFIPDPRYATHAANQQAVRDEFRAMVGELHRNGIEVVLDVVYNHTAEGGAGGPTLSWRGLDNASSYALDRDGNFLDFTGCGNSVNMGEPRMVQFVMDSLRWWVQAFGVDGFRFDLAATLGRDPALHHQFNRGAALLTAIVQDPLLSRVRLIAEPWDVAPGGYQVGAFAPGWQEWNDRFRDTARLYWLEHECTPGQLARRMTGSDDLFADDGRSPLASINMITAHDGFTLADLTAYRYRHNEANGEDNRDGHGHNHSANGGVEGPSQDAAVLRKRTAWRRALLATLLLAQGTPQLLAGDELGNSQQGNNNAYCQDNAIGWLDWAHADESLLALVSALTALRRQYPAFRHPRWFRGHPFHEPGHPFTPGGDIAWLRPDGVAMSDADWDDPWDRSFAYVVEVGEGGAPATERVMVLMHPAHSTLPFVLPAGAWRVALDTSAPEPGGGAASSDRYELAGPALCVLVQGIAS